jgi:hypothetical protein
MEKKTIFLELPCELIDKIDKLNTLGDRSTFITDLLKKQVNEEKSDMTNEVTTKMSETDNSLGITGTINLVNNDGVTLGTFNINTVEGFEDLAKKIQEVSEDPMVRIKARRLI